MNNINRYLNYLKNDRNSPENTIEAYRVDLTQFYKSMGVASRFATTEDILKFLRKLRDQGFAETTRNRKLASIKSYYGYLASHGYISFNPASNIESVQEVRSVPVLVLPEEYRKMMDMVDNSREAALLELLYMTGLRRQEAVSLRKSQLDFRNGKLKVMGKGAKERVVPISAKHMPHTITWLKQTGSQWVFPSTRTRGQHYAPRWVNNIVEKWVKKAGVNPEITPHSFRRAFGTNLFDNGADSYTIQRVLGHESINTTNLYIQASTKRIEEDVMKAMDSLLSDL